uniref:Vpr n=1 Tax=Simian immunodeficiency virus TaxID=11723 RepID=Q87483_SIV|nr:Vpr [Simian immunodeficiency virus]
MASGGWLPPMGGDPPKDPPKNPREEIPGWLETWDLAREPFDEWLRDMLQDLNQEAQCHFPRNLLFRLWWNIVEEPAIDRGQPRIEGWYKYYRILQKALYVHMKGRCCKPKTHPAYGPGAGGPPPGLGGTPGGASAAAPGL